jgi:hypothetical protein
MKRGYIHRKKIGDHALVIGGSLGGLFAARVLADFFDKVTILDRDVFPVVPPRWLVELGYEAPSVETITSNLRYSSRFYAKPDEFAAEMPPLIADSGTTKERRWFSRYLLRSNISGKSRIELGSY